MSSTKEKFLPLRNKDLLAAMTGQSIVEVKRQLFKGDFDLADYEQSADGPLQLSLSNGEIIHFIAIPEQFSIGIIHGEMTAYGDDHELRLLTDSVFWQARVGKTIEKVIVFKDKNAYDDYFCEFGILMSFNGGEAALIEYVDDHLNSDKLRVSSSIGTQSANWSAVPITP